MIREHHRDPGVAVSMEMVDLVNRGAKPARSAALSARSQRSPAGPGHDRLRVASP